MFEKHRLEIMSDEISQGEIDNMSSWSCPVCGDRVERKLLRGADEGRFPQDYDYTLYESNANFLLKIIQHVCTHLRHIFGLDIKVKG